MKANGERIVVSDPTKDGSTLSLQPKNLRTMSPIEWGAEQWVAKPCHVDVGRGGKITS